MGYTELRRGMRARFSDPLNRLIADLPQGENMLEVGCYAGESTILFCQSNKYKTIYAVDPWERTDKQPQKMADDMDWAEWSFDQRAKGFDVVKLKGVLNEFTHIIPPLDLVYIDADHGYEAVKSDILLSLKLVKPNGIISGHDYNLEGVKKAVNEILGTPDSLYGNNWMIKL